MERKKEKNWEKTLENAKTLLAVIKNKKGGEHFEGLLISFVQKCGKALCQAATIPIPIIFDEDIDPDRGKLWEEWNFLIKKIKSLGMPGNQLSKSTDSLKESLMNFMKTQSNEDSEKCVNTAETFFQYVSKLRYQINFKQHGE